MDSGDEEEDNQEEPEVRRRRIFSFVLPSRATCFTNETSSSGYFLMCIYHL